MSRRSTNGLSIVACDYPGCTGKFHTYSLVAIARKQAAKEGWTRRRGQGIAHPEHQSLIVSNKTVDICPSHGELPKPVRIKAERKKAG